VARHPQESPDSKERLMALVSGRNEASSAKELVADDTTPRSWPERLTIKDGNEFQFIKIADIQWIDAAGDYMCVHVAGKTHIMRTTMKRLEASLNPELFIRVHRSSIVNANCIVSAVSHLNGEYVLSLDGGGRLKVSRSYRDKIKFLLDA
jgi:two-component system LytT family response regulator